MARTPGARSPDKYALTVLRFRPTWRAIAEFDHPRDFNAVISTSSSGLSIEAGLLLHAGVVLVDHQRQWEPTPHVWMLRGGERQRAGLGSSA
jgi:hypothetical protein